MRKINIKFILSWTRKYAIGLEVGEGNEACWSSSKEKFFNEDHILACIVCNFNVREIWIRDHWIVISDPSLARLFGWKTHNLRIHASPHTSRLAVMKGPFQLISTSCYEVFVNGTLHIFTQVFFFFAVIVFYVIWKKIY